MACCRGAAGVSSCIGSAPTGWRYWRLTQPLRPSRSTTAPQAPLDPTRSTSEPPAKLPTTSPSVAGEARSRRTLAVVVWVASKVGASLTGPDADDWPEAPVLAEDGTAKSDRFDGAVCGPCPEKRLTPARTITTAQKTPLARTLLPFGRRLRTAPTFRTRPRRAHRQYHHGRRQDRRRPGP